METQNINEVLIVAARSAAPFSASVVSSFNGHAFWSYKGNELRGAPLNVFEPVGLHVDYIATASSYQPFLHFITPKKPTVTTTLPGKPDAVKITRTGRFAFVLIDSKIYSYDLHNGQLIKIVTHSFLKSTKMFMCSNDKYVALPMHDGNLFVYTIGSLLLQPTIFEDEVSPYHSFLAHSKEINDISFSRFDSAFMLSVGLDCRLVLCDLEHRVELIKLSFDCELTSCALNLSDTKLLCGTKTGRLVELSIFQIIQSDQSTCFIQTQNAGEFETHVVLDRHNGKAICKICLNLDGSKIATGDVEGKVMVWDASSNQILIRIRKDDEIQTLRFAHYWPWLLDANYEPDSASIQKFQHEMTADKELILKTDPVTNNAHELRQKYLTVTDMPISLDAKHINEALVISDEIAQETADDLEELRLDEEIKTLITNIDRLMDENCQITEMILTDDNLIE